MFACCERSFDIFRLREDGKGEDDGVDVGAQEEIVVGFARTGVGGVKVDIGAGREGEGLCGLESARVDGLEG